MSLIVEGFSFHIILLGAIPSVALVELKNDYLAHLDRVSLISWLAHCSFGIEAVHKNYLC